MKIRTGSLKNQLRYLLTENKNSPSVTVMVLVGVGSRYETDRQAGLAHFIEHTVFKGTAKRPNSEIISNEIESLGGHTNAFTSQDYTGYYIKVPAINFRNSFLILSDFVLNPLFEEAELNKERGVILEEIRMYEDIPRSKVDDLFMRNMFGSHPLGREITGSVESVSALKRNDFIKFKQQFYTGCNMVVSISGNFNQSEAIDLITENFSALHRGERAIFKKLIEKRPQKHTEFVQKKLEQTHLVFGGFGYERDNEQRFPYQLGNAILGSGFGSRLFKVIRDKLGLAYYANSSLSPFKETGIFSIHMGVDNKRVVAAVNAAFAELKAIANGDFSDAELNRAKNYLIGTLTTQIEASDDVALWYGLQLLLRKEMLSAKETIAKIQKVSREDIIKAWQGLTDAGNMQLTTLGPNKPDADAVSFN